MNRTYILLISFIFIFLSNCHCAINSNEMDPNQKNISNQMTDTIAQSQIKDDFNFFWINFQNKVKSGEEIKTLLSFPIYAINIVDYEDACDCDTIKYIREYEKYKDVVITESNFDNYQELLYSQNLIKVISRTSYESFIDSIEFDAKEKEFYSIYTVRPSELGLSKCSNDGFVRFIILKKGKEIKLKIIGLY